MRDQSSLSTRLFDLACVLVLGLLLTFLAGVIARANAGFTITTRTALVHAPGAATAAGAAVKAEDCDSPAKPDAPAATASAAVPAPADAHGAPVKTGEQAKGEPVAMAGGLPASMSVGACADGGAKPATAPAPQPQH